MTPSEPASHAWTGSSESLIRLISDSVPALIAYYEVGSFRCLFANQRYAEAYGFTPQSILGKTVREAIGDAAWLVIEPYVAKARAGIGSTHTRELSLPSGEQRMIEVNVRPHLDDAGQLQGAFVLTTDITDRWRYEQALAQSEERLRKFADATNEGILFHKDRLITDINEALLRISGFTRAEVVGHSTVEFIPDNWLERMRLQFESDNELPYESALVHKDGHEIPVECVTKNLVFEGERLRLLVVRDMSAHKQAQARIEFLAMHDPLTELPNRSYLMERLDTILALAHRQERSAAVLFIDLDNFKTINDSLGHHVGDDLLREVAKRLAISVRDSDVVSRLGGDEFVVVLSDVASSEDAGTVASKLIESISGDFMVDGRQLSVSPSIGISVYPADGDNSDELIRHADAAMYHAKESGRRHFQFFLPAMFERAVNALDKERELKGALARGEFVLNYQPKRNCVGGAIVGLEVLVRWQHPTRGLVEPEDFIGFAELRGLIVAIDRWVLQNACAQLKAWHDQGCLKVPVAINLSAIEFKQGDLLADVVDVLAQTGLAPEYLELELTESVVMERNTRVMAILTGLSALGVGLTIDDFGTGYSSLAYLKRYPIDKLKIDRSFISDFTTDEDDMAITTAIIQMAHGLKLQTVAEGVETQAQHDALARLGCDQVQGFFISLPLAASDVPAYLAR